MRTRTSQLFRLALREYSETLAAAVLLALVVRIFVINAYRVPTPAMVPTLLPGDFVFSYRLSYGFPIPWTQARLATSTPKRGDVVVAYFPGHESTPYVRRVVGLPGDRIEIRDFRLLINDVGSVYQPIEGSGLSEETLPGLTQSYKVQWGDLRHEYGPVVVPPNQFFLLSDNRQHGEDSRFFSTVPLRSIEGQIEVIWFSINWSALDGGMRWDRFFERIR